MIHTGDCVEVIRSILGHTNATMTAHYARPEDDMKRDALERLGRAVAS